MAITPQIRGKGYIEHLLQNRRKTRQKHPLTCGYLFFRGGGIDNATLCDALRDGIPRGVSPPVMELRSMTDGRSATVLPILSGTSTRSGGIRMKSSPDDLREKRAFFREKHPLTCGYAEKSRGERGVQPVEMLY